MRMKVSGLLAAGVLAGCAMTYELPRTQPTTATGRTSATPAEAIAASRTVLVSEGFQVMSADDGSGTLSTAMRSFRLTPDQADCGTTMGIDYLKDKRTSTRLGYNVLAQPDGTLMVRALLEGDYRPGSGIQDIALTCVSRGQLEHALLGKIAAAVRR